MAEKWTSKTDLGTPADADLFLTADMSATAGSRDRTLTFAGLKSALAIQDPTEISASDTVDATFAGGYYIATSNLTLTLPSGLTGTAFAVRAASGITVTVTADTGVTLVGNGATSDTITLDDDAPFGTFIAETTTRWGGDRSLASSSSGTLTVAEVDGTPSVSATSLKFPNSTLANASGVVTYAPADLIYNVRTYGATGDGSTNDTTALQAAIDAAELTGGTVYLPRGTYVTGDLAWSVNTATHTDKVSIIGAGYGATKLQYTGTGTGYCLTITAGATGIDTHVTLRDFRITAATPANHQGRGVKLDTCGYVLMSGVLISGLNIGMTLVDTLSSRFYGCRFANNNYGLEALASVSFTNPNSLDFYGCQIIANLEAGATFTNPGGVRFFGGSIENNGVDGDDTDRYGLKLVSPGVEGAAAAQLYGLYIEGNYETDVWIDAGTSPIAIHVSGCVFNRNTGTAGEFSTNNILVDQGASDGAIVLSVIGCGFRGFNTYTASASRPYIQINESTAGVRLEEVGNYYHSALEAPSPSGVHLETFTIACSDETTALTTGTAKATFRMPYAMTLTGVRANVKTAPTGSTLTVDINEGGTSILSTKLTIDASEKTSTTAATAAVISDSALADDAEITIDIDQVGSTIAGAGLKVTLLGYKA